MKFKKKKKIYNVIYLTEENKYVMINDWYGRLGNNIIQLYKALLYCKKNNLNLIYPLHKYFNSKNIQICKDLNIILTDNFYYFDIFKDNNININIKSDILDKSFIFFNYKELNKIFIRLNIDDNYIINKLRTQFTIIDYPKHNNNDIVIHIRSGDLFSNNPHSYYLPPPLSFYVNILKNNKFDKIILLSEDKKNPVISELMKLFPNIIFELKNLDDDIKIILSARNIISSIGTFIPSLMLLSNNIENIYHPSYCPINYFCNLNIKKVNIKKINLDNYYKKMIPWKNSHEQNNYLLNYRDED